MKKLTVYVMMALLSLTFIPTQSIAGTETTSMKADKAAESARAHVLLNRLNEINAMDKSKLTSSQKKELRNEVRSTRKQLRGISGGIYLSATAIIIILLVLIILL